MNKSIVYLICLMVLLFVGITGCGPQDETQALPYTRYVESYDGVRVAVPDHPKRILALSSASDTILLGLVEPDRLVGINKLSTYEEYSLEAKRAKLVKPVMSSYPLEKIIALHPDLVIAPDYTTSDVTEGLRHMGIPRGQTRAVIQQNLVAVAVVPAGDNDRAAVSS